MEDLTRQQLADFFAGGYGFPHDLLEAADDREVRVRYRGIGLFRHESPSARAGYWIPGAVHTEVLMDGLPTQILPDDFMPLDDLLSTVETIRSLDAVIDWVLDE